MLTRRSGVVARLASGKRRRERSSRELLTCFTFILSGFRPKNRIQSRSVLVAESEPRPTAACSIEDFIVARTMLLARNSSQSKIHRLHARLCLNVRPNLKEGLGFQWLFRWVRIAESLTRRDLAIKAGLECLVGGGLVDRRCDSRARRDPPVRQHMSATEIPALLSGWWRPRALRGLLTRSQALPKEIRGEFLAIATSVPGSFSPSR